MTDSPRRFRRPAAKPAAELDAFMGSSADPAAVVEAAHHSAAVLVGHGRASADPQVTAHLVDIIDEVGIETVAQLWAERPARSLPGALWRLYVIREWVRRDPVGASHDYDSGRRFADVSVVVAGVADPPGPTEIRAVADDILRGVFDGDVAVALDRAAAFARVVAAGRGEDADPGDSGDTGPVDASEMRPEQFIAAVAGTSRRRPSRPSSGMAMLTLADDLEASASAWRAGVLD